MTPRGTVTVSDRVARVSGRPTTNSWSPCRKTTFAPVKRRPVIVTVASSPMRGHLDVLDDAA